MRIDAGDPETGQWVCSAFGVWIDGIRQEGCVMADDERDCAEVVVLDEHGHLIANEALPRGIETRMVWGQVEIRDHNAHDAALYRQYAARDALLARYGEEPG